MNIRLTLFLIPWTALISACSRPVPKPLLAPVFSFQSPLLLKNRFSTRPGGYVTELHAAPGSGDLVFSTRGDAAGGGHLVIRIHRDGKVLWKKKIPNLILSVAPAREGGAVYYSAYPQEIGRLNSKGALDWKIEGLCRPVAAADDRMICLQDDDAEPDVAFDIYDAKGKRIHRESTQEPPVAFQLDSTGRTLAVAYPKGRVDWFQIVGEPKKIGSWQLKGEVSDIALWNDAQGVAKMAVILTDLKKNKRLAWTDREHKEILGDALLSFSAEQVEWSREGHSLLLIDPAGRSVTWQIAQWVEGRLVLLPSWRSGFSADYAVSARAHEAGWAVYLGVQPSQGSLTRKGMIQLLDGSGRSMGSAEPEIENAGYLFDFDWAGDTLYYATDTGVVGAFGLE